MKFNLKLEVINLNHHVLEVMHHTVEAGTLQQAIEFAESDQIGLTYHQVARVCRIIAVTRHPGASEWLAKNNIQATEHIQHLTQDFIEGLGVNDAVVSTPIPFDMAADICGKGAEFYAISMNMPFEARGKDLSADEMDAYGAEITQYKVEVVGKG